MATIREHIVNPQLRSVWDSYAWKYQPMQEVSDNFRVDVVYPSSRSRGTLVGMVCKTEVGASSTVITYQSHENSKYKVKITYTLQEGSNQSDELDTMPSISDRGMFTNVLYRCKMPMKLAKNLNSEFNGESCFIETSWVNLKRVVEGEPQKYLEGKSKGFDILVGKRLIDMWFTESNCKYQSLIVKNQPIYTSKF